MACGYCDVVVLPFAELGLSKVATYGNDPIGTRHLELEVCIIGDGHELDIAWSPQDVVIGAKKVRFLKGECFRAEVYPTPESSDRSIYPRGTTCGPSMTSWNGAPYGRMTARDSPMAS